MQISHKILHHPQIKHSTESYTNKKGHKTHNEHTQKIKAILATGHGGL
jgi:hypothetical protein